MGGVRGGATMEGLPPCDFLLHSTHEFPRPTQGDVGLIARDTRASVASSVQVAPTSRQDDLEDEPEEHHDWLHGHTAVKFLLAGGIAGAGEALVAHKRRLLTFYILFWQFRGRVLRRLTVSKFF